MFLAGEGKIPANGCLDCLCIRTWWKQGNLNIHLTVEKPQVIFGVMHIPISVDKTVGLRLLNCVFAILDRSLANVERLRKFSSGRDLFIMLVPNLQPL